MQFTATIALLATAATAFGAPSLKDFRLRTTSSDSVADGLTLSAGSWNAAHTQGSFNLVEDHKQGSIFNAGNGTLLIAQKNGNEVLTLAPLVGDEPKSIALIATDVNRAAHVGYSAEGLVTITYDETFGGWLACDNTLSYLKRDATVPGDCSEVELEVTHV